VIPGMLQSALEPFGLQAAAINTLWWLLLVVCTAVWVAVMVALALALFRRNRTEQLDPQDGEPRKVRVVGAAVGMTGAILIVFVAYSVVVARSTTRTPSDEDRPVRIVVTAHQWWWEVEYQDEVASRTFKTANELRVPVGRPVVVELLSRDVIHSFWVPNLSGKTDVIPGRRNQLWFEATAPGVYRGQCAEFCGLQHANMAFVVVAVPDGDFESWAAANRAPAVVAVTDEARQGAEVFARSSCVMCHTIRGTGAWGQVAPDLTHMASRLTLASGTLPNTRGDLGGWILDPDHVKPGTQMPPTHLAPADLQALLTYLRTLE
jgi:cytochrome c oxidase subunit II